MTFGSQGTAHLSPRFSGDGSFSLYSVEYGEGFHCRSGALLEAQRTFVRPAQLERFCAGEELWVVDVCVGLGTNSAALLEAAAPAACACAGSGWRSIRPLWPWLWQSRAFVPSGRPRWGLICSGSCGTPAAGGAPTARGSCTGVMPAERSKRCWSAQLVAAIW